jgi:hypothetical protein
MEMNETIMVIGARRPVSSSSSASGFICENLKSFWHIDIVGRLCVGRRVSDARPASIGYHSRNHFRRIQKQQH